MSVFNAAYAHVRVIALAMALFAGSSAAAADAPYPGTMTVASKHGFDELVSRVEAAVSDHKMGLVAQASASRGAAARGVRIPGNAVLMVFRNDYAVRMLQASVHAGIAMQQELDRPGCRDAARPDCP